VNNNISTSQKCAAWPAMPDSRRIQVQDRWLVQACRRRVTVRLVDGRTLTGMLGGFDTFSLVLAMPTTGETVLVYKHAIAYLMPARSETDTA
jgi:RNA chaperone Hfq